MNERRPESVLIGPRDVQASRRDWEVVGVFNPGVALVGDQCVMLARVAERPAEQRVGWTPLPRWSLREEIEVDWVRDDDLIHIDARVVAMKSSGDLRLTSISHLQIFRQSKRNANAWDFVHVVLPEGPWEEFGIEDPRITKIGDTYWVTYVAVSRWGAATALMSSADLVTFRRHGIIFASENKDVVLFPDLIAGDYVSLHRPNPRSHFSPPQIWLARSPDLIHWGRHELLLSGAQVWEGDRVGSGTPPVLIDEGWLTLYHGSTRSNVDGTVGCYAAGALLLDRNAPGRVLARSNEPVMSPTCDFEIDGFVPNVVFPTAMLDLGDELQVFYGAADTCVAVTRLSKRSVLDSLSPSKSSELAL